MSSKGARRQNIGQVHLVHERRGRPGRGPAARGWRRAAVSGGASVLCAAAITTSYGTAEQLSSTTYNAYGAPGLVDMPVATMPGDAETAITLSRAAGTTRTTFNFQVLPRVSGSFRYSIVDDYSGPGDDLFDRSFDLRLSVLEERTGWPGLTVGLQDFLGTGVFSGEYVVATKTVAPGLRLTGGIGWGRFGIRNGFDNPLGIVSGAFDNRPPVAEGGGRFNADNWFRGDASVFGGVRYDVTDRLSLAAEYSSDTYANEEARGLFTPGSPFNFSVTYRATPAIDVTAFALHGEAFGLAATTRFNPKHPPLGPTTGDAPPPVVPRADLVSLGWGDAVAGGADFRRETAARLAAEGIGLGRLEVDGRTARIGIRNLRYRSDAQAVGRAARVLTRTMPRAVDAFVLTLTENGLPITDVTLRRADIEALEFAPDGAAQSLARAAFGDASGTPVAASPPRFEWAIGPYLDTELFDPDDPLRVDVGARLRGRLAFGTGTFLSGSVRKRVFGSLDQSTRSSNSVLPRVRSDNAIYNREGDPALEYLVGEQFFRPGGDLYARVSAGYLEKMYGGVSAEVLWLPQTSDLGLGVEINYARQRDFDQLFGFRDYDVVTGHVSAYYDLGEGFVAQVDAGRYLAGDWGATVALDREFANGVRVGAFATFTDVGFDDFGEGSFDKGIRVTLPVAWFTGRESRQALDTTIRPVLRDGGARLSVPHRLYPTVRGARESDLGQDWGRFWR